MSINGVVTLPPIQVQPSALPPFSVTDIRKRAHAIQEVMKGVMKEGTHFGTIPGTPTSHHSGRLELKCSA